MTDAFELEICQGKYRYRYEGGKQEVWRNGDTWPAMNGKLIGDKFVFSLAVELDEALKERDTLRARIEAMEQQEPARLVTATAYRWRYRGAIKWQYGELTEETVMAAKEHNHEVQPLYALPGAQPAQLGYVPASSVHSVIHWLRNGCDPMEAADELEMLTAAPEAKP